MENLSYLYAGNDLNSKITARHSHRGWELLYLAEGSFNITFDTGKSLNCTPGDLLFISPHTIHVRQNTSGTKTLYAVFETTSPDWEPHKIISTGRDNFLENWLTDLAELHKKNLPTQCLLLLKIILERALYLSPDAEKRMLPAALLKACRFIGDNYSRPLSIPEIAASAATSPSHINRLFRTHLQMTPLKYLRMIRMQTARQLLMDPGNDIAHVSESCGYDDQHYFTRVFTKVHGAPPGVFRKSPGRFADTENKGYGKLL